MFFKKIILSLILIEVAINCFIEGLQCYVCEDCNEYEDFKELHICGEISIEVTINPITLPDISETTAKVEPTINPIVESSITPVAKPSTDDYLYEENQTEVSSASSKQTGTTKAATLKTTKVTWIGKTQKSTILAENPITESYATDLFQISTIEHLTTTTQSLVTNNQQQQQQEEIVEESTVGSNTTSLTVTTTKPISILIPEYDDYLEYEDPLQPPDRQSGKSLSQSVEPVCYMIKYHVNNTILTKRGCTTFISANKYMTCQSLYNGASMETCRICFSNGCNKFQDNVGEEDYNGIYLNASGIREQFYVINLLFWVLFNRSII